MYLSENESKVVIIGYFCVPFYNHKPRIYKKGAQKMPLKDVKQEDKLSINQKLILTLSEASEYSNIGINRIAAALKKPNCTFVFYSGNRKLVKRKEFEEYISNNKIL